MKVNLTIMLKHLPNILTLGRIVLTIIFLIMLLYSPTVENKPLFLDIAFAIFVVAGLTDTIDGAIARKLGVTSKFGRIMDPLADKVLVCGAFICFAVIGEPKLFNFGSVTLAFIQWFVVGVLILRDVSITILRQVAETRGINFAATTSGKLKMFLQSFAVGTMVIKIAHVPTATWGYWFTAVVLILMLAVTVISGIKATRRSFRKKTVV